MRFLISIFMFVVTISILHSQHQVDQNEINAHLDLITIGMKNGDKDILKEISQYLDNKNPILRETQYGTRTTQVNIICHGIIYRYTNFKGLEINQDLDQKTFVKFLNENWEKINYSKVLKKLTDIDLKNYNVEYRLEEEYPTDSKDELFKLYLSKYKEDIENENHSRAINAITDIGELGLSESYNFILECLNNKCWGEVGERDESRIYSDICVLLGKYPTLKSLETMLEIIGNHELYSEKDCYKSLSIITNNDLPLQEYQKLIKKYKSIFEIREQGYNILSKKKYDFQDEINFYEYVISEENDYWWLKYNAISDLLILNNPRGLALISRLVYNNSLRGIDVNPVDSIKKYTRVEVFVKDRNGLLTNQYNDDVSRFNYMMYWNIFSSDWVWVDETKIFQNNKGIIHEPNNFDYLFNFLTSVNDSISLNAYIRLGDSAPEDVLPRINLYDFWYSLYGNEKTVNRILPTFSKKFLMQIPLFTEYCKSQNIQYKPDTVISSLFGLLNGYDSLSENYTGENILFIKSKDVSSKKSINIQNIMLDKLELKHLTMVEYIGIINQGNYSFSAAGIGRILNILYSRYWDQIINDEKQLKWYLKKSHIFDNLGIVGFVNGAYLNKFKNSNVKTIESLKNLASKCEDFDIKNQAIKVLGLIDIPYKEKTVKLDSFLNDINPKIAAIISFKPTNKNYEKVISKIQSEKNIGNINSLIILLFNNSSVNMVPHLFDIINDERILDEGYSHATGVDGSSHYFEYTITVSDRIVSLIESIYEHSFPIEHTQTPKTKMVSGFQTSSAYFADKSKSSNQWINLWSEDSINYLNWGEVFFDKKLKIVIEKDSVNVNELNGIANSDYFESKHEEIWLNSVNKLTKSRANKYLIIPRHIKLSEIESFEKIIETPDDIIPFIKKVEFESKQEALTFIKKLATNFSDEEIGALYLSLLNDYNKFKQWVTNQDSINIITKAEIIDRLMDYQKVLREDSYEFKSSLKNINDLSAVDKDLSKLFDNALTINNEKEKEDFLKDYFTNLSYNDLHIFLSNVDTIKTFVSDYSIKAFINGDFGIPIENIEDSTINELLTIYSKKTEQGLYKHYALEIYPKLYRDNEIDYNVAYNILKYDCADSFASNYKSYPDDYVILVIRLLEIEHDTRLGHEFKFNDHFDHRGWAVCKRAKDWRSFLKENNLIKSDLDEVPSFDD